MNARGGTGDHRHWQTLTILTAIVEAMAATTFNTMRPTEVLRTISSSDHNLRIHQSSTFLFTLNRMNRRAILMNHWQEDALHFSFHFKAKQSTVALSIKEASEEG